jgi:high-affinity Fe2+/Pb2+ permease
MASKEILIFFMNYIGIVILWYLIQYGERENNYFENLILMIIAIVLVRITINK